jgi:hypothetical protein
MRQSHTTQPVVIKATFNEASPKTVKGDQFIVQWVQ